MSRVPPRNSASQNLPGQDDGELLPHLPTLNHRKLAKKAPDICPVCKSSKYLNPQMHFKINTECYHKMCESCVDRIFSQGPAPCPVAGCAKTLRKQRFKTQTFGSISVEREVDIRRRVAATFVHLRYENESNDKI